MNISSFGYLVERPSLSVSQPEIRHYNIYFTHKNKNKIQKAIFLNNRKKTKIKQQH